MSTPNPEVREWWQETPSTSLPPPPATQARRRGLLDHHLENVMLPPRPSEVPDHDFHDISFMEDEAFADEKKKSKFAFSMLFPGLRRSLQTFALLLFLVALGFFAGYEFSGGGSSTADSKGKDQLQNKNKANEVGSVDDSLRPLCGAEFIVENGVGFGGHNVGLGCTNAGRLTWGACIKVFEKRSRCTAATYKDGECWLHDRHQEVSG
jgi:hypothetical protein